MRIVSLRKLAFVKQAGRCYYCDIPMTPSANGAPRPHWRSCTAEHLVARQDGGEDSAENVVAACHYCNRRRHARPHPLSAAEYLRHV